MPTVKELRVSKGWSQQELATRAGVGIHAVGRLEKGDSVYKATLSQICQAIEVDPSEITGVNIVNRVAKSQK